MHNLFGWFLALFAGFWLFLAARGMAREFKGGDRSRWATGLMFFLVMVGAGGFFAAALSATGILKLPDSWEWPAGYVRGVVTAIDGKHIVPLVLRQGGYRYTTHNGISSGDGMSMRREAILIFGALQII